MRLMLAGGGMPDFDCRAGVCGWDSSSGTDPLGNMIGSREKGSRKGRVANASQASRARASSGARPSRGFLFKEGVSEESKGRGLSPIRIPAQFRVGKDPDRIQIALQRCHEGWIPGPPAAQINWAAKARRLLDGISNRPGGDLDQSRHQVGRRSLGVKFTSMGQERGPEFLQTGAPWNFPRKEGVSLEGFKKVGNAGSRQGEGSVGVAIPQALPASESIHWTVRGTAIPCPRGGISLEQGEV